MEKDDVLKLDLQLFADDDNGGDNGGTDSGDSDKDNGGGENNNNGGGDDKKRIAELEKELAESKKRNDKLKGTLDVKLKELGDMTKKERDRMTAEERERQQIEEIKEQNALLLKERDVVNAERRFIQIGCDADLATEGAKALIDSDYDALFGVFEKLVENKIALEKQELLKTMPKPQGGGSSSTMTQKDFNRLGYKDRVKLLEKDPDTYNKFAQ